MLKLMSDEQIIATYGDLYKYIDEDGGVISTWQMSILDSFQLLKPLPLSWGGQVSRISCHRLVKPELESLFQKLAKMPDVWATINDYGGCYNFRRNRFNHLKQSRHSWAIALDLDVKDSDSGGSPHPLVIQGFYDIGWLWGGWFSNKDLHHFEKAVSI